MQENKEQSDVFEVGKQYFVRTVTYHAIGVCVEVRETRFNEFVLLDKAMWVADSGVLTQALKEGIHKQPSAELEVFPGILNINISAISDFVEYLPEIELKQK